MTNFVEWTAEYDGHKPKHWRDGMAWDCKPFNSDNSLVYDEEPDWLDHKTYRVPREAVEGPSVDWTKPICTAPTDWQPSIDAELVSAPDDDGDYSVRVLGEHRNDISSVEYDGGETWHFTKEGLYLGEESNPNYIRIINRTEAVEGPARKFQVGDRVYTGRGDGTVAKTGSTKGLNIRVQLDRGYMFWFNEIDLELIEPTPVEQPISPVLYERMANLVKALPVSRLSNAMGDEVRAIAAELEPVDPIVKLAREVCDEVAPRSADQQYTSALYDDEIVMKVALAMGRAMKERGL